MELSQVSSLPPIPESIRSNLHPRLVLKLFDFDRYRAQPDTTHLIRDGSKATGLRTFEHFDSISARLSRGRRKASLKSQISDPALNHTASMPLSRSIDDIKEEEACLSSIDTELMMPTGLLPDNPVRACGQAKCVFEIAPPRLSPMEYARMYLLRQANCLQDEEFNELPELEKEWYWTPGWEKFLILPRIPWVVNQSMPSTLKPDGIKDDASTLTSTSATTSSPMPNTLASGCPRLSLHLGGITALLPSVMNLAALGMACRMDSTSLDGHPDVQACLDLQRRSWLSDSNRFSLTLHPDAQRMTPCREHARSAPSQVQWPPLETAFSISPRENTTSGNGYLPLLLPRTFERPVREYSWQDSFDSDSAPSQSGSTQLLNGDTASNRHLFMGITSPGAQLAPAVKQSHQVGGHTIERSSLSASLTEDWCKGQYPRYLRDSTQLTELLNEKRRRRASSFDTLQCKKPIFDHTRSCSIGSQIETRLNPRRPRSISDYQNPFECSASEGNFSTCSISHDRWQYPCSDVASSLLCGQTSPENPLPDSPTLGHVESTLLTELQHSLSDGQAFDFLDSCMRRRKRHAMSHDRDSPDCLFPGVQFLHKRAKSRQISDKSDAPYHYDSSFVLSRLKREEASTILPLAAPLFQEKRSGMAIASRNPLQLMSDRFDRTRGFSDSSTVLHLQKLDTASRLAVYTKQRDGAVAQMVSSGNPTPLAEAKRFGTAHFRHIRSKSSGGPGGNVGTTRKESATLTNVKVDQSQYIEFRDANGRQDQGFWEIEEVVPSSRRIPSTSSSSSNTPSSSFSGLKKKFQDPFYSFWRK